MKRNLVNKFQKNVLENEEKLESIFLFDIYANMRELISDNLAIALSEKFHVQKN